MKNLFIILMSSVFIFSGCQGMGHRIHTIEVSDADNHLIATISDPAIAKRLDNALRHKEMNDVKFMYEWLITVNYGAEVIRFSASRKNIKIDGISYRIPKPIEDVLQLKTQP
jgi:hypothetical protein